MCLVQITNLVRGELHSTVDVNQLEGHGNVLVAVSRKWSFSFRGILHSALGDKC